MLKFENEAKARNFKFIIGVDEAGRGPLAGPVVAAAVMLTNQVIDHPIRDSKKLSAKMRESAFQEITEKTKFGIGVISESVIDQVNILQATYLAMNRAVEQLLFNCDQSDQIDINQKDNVCLLIDGNRFKTAIPCTYRCIVKGDSLSYSIACASIVAKVFRDRLLLAYDKIYPMYGFRQHKGYPTSSHKLAIQKFGLSDIHRKTFNHS